MKPWSRFAVSTLAFLVAGLTPPPAAAQASARPAWIAKSDAHAKVLVDVLKSRVELALGKSFDRKRYHDFLLAQGLLPPAVLTKTVLAEFVPREPAKGDR